MASWIVHLRIAEKLLADIPGLDAGMFAIGNVAPDSGVPDEKWEHFDPPSEVSHYWHPRKGRETWCADLVFYREYLADDSAKADRLRFSFLVGYFCHLLTDNLWYIHIGLPTKQKYPDQFAADKDFIWEVKRDWYGLDFAYVRTHPDSLFWRVFLRSEYTDHYLEFYPPQAIPDRLDYIKTYYQRTDKEVDEKLRLINNIYLTKAEMDAFVDRAVADLRSIYELVWRQDADTAEHFTALELLDYIL